MLGLQRQSIVAGVRPTALPYAAAVEKIAAVELHTGLGGGHLEHTSRVGLIDRRHNGQGSGGQSSIGHSDHPVVVVPLAELELLIGRADPCADRRRLAEVERQCPLPAATPPKG